MTFEEFKRIVAGYLYKAGISAPTRARVDDHGRYVTRHGDVVIMGNSFNRTLTVRYGNHQFMKRV